MPYSTPADVESEWMKVTEAAAVIGVDPRTVKAQIDKSRSFGSSVPKIPGRGEGR